MTLAPLDLAVVAAFVAAILGLGFSARLRDHSVLQFLAAGRSLSLPAFVATLVSTWYGGILGIGESVGAFGFGTWLLFGVPYYAFALFYALVLAKKVRAAEQISIPERLQMRWGRWAALVGAGLVFLLAVPAAHVLMLGVLIEGLSGWGLGASVVAGAVVGTLFLYKGGLLADVRAGFLAFVMMYVGFGAMVAFCLTEYPLFATFEKIRNRDLLTLTGGVGWPVVLSMFVLGAWTLADPGFHQRVAAASSPEVGRRGVLVSVGFWMLFDLMSVLVGMYGLALLSPVPTDLKALFPALGEAILPPGLKAVFLCGMLGTITSAMVGYTLVSGATLGREIVGRLRPDLSEDRIKSWTRIGFGVATLVAVAVGLRVESVVSLWYSWAGAMVGALVLPVVIAYGRSSRIPGGFAAAAMGLSAAVSLGWMAVGLRTNNPFLEVVFVKAWGTWTVALPPVAPERLAEAQASWTFGVGTLLPGLAVSAAVLLVGAAIGGERQE